MKAKQTDRGSGAYNDQLSTRRADAVKAVLVMRGMDPARINTQGFGKAYPVVSNADSAGRRLNRQVEMVIGGGRQCSHCAQGMIGVDFEGLRRSIHANKQ